MSQTKHMHRKSKSASSRRSRGNRRVAGSANSQIGECYRIVGSQTLQAKNQHGFSVNTPALMDFLINPPLFRDES